METPRGLELQQIRKGNTVSTMNIPDQKPKGKTIRRNVTPVAAPHPNRANPAQIHPLFSDSKPGVDPSDQKKDAEHE